MGTKIISMPILMRSMWIKFSRNAAGNEAGDRSDNKKCFWMKERNFKIKIPILRSITIFMLVRCALLKVQRSQGSYLYGEIAVGAEGF